MMRRGGKAAFTGVIAGVVLAACGGSSSHPQPSVHPFSPLPSATTLIGATLNVPNQAFRVGGYINAGGKGWNASGVTKASLQQGGKVTDLGVVAVKADGSFNTQLQVPKTLTAGIGLLEICSYNKGSSTPVGCLSQIVSLSS